MLAPTAYSEPVNQATVEAAITLQLLSFTEWPSEEAQASSSIKRIGVFQSQDHLAAFQSLVEEPNYKGRFSAAPIQGELTADQLDQFDAIFFHAPDGIAIPRLVRKLETRPVVLVGAFEGFLDQGGLVNLVKNQKRLGFEIQLANSKRRGIEYRAKLLRLASKIIKE